MTDKTREQQADAIDDLAHKLVAAMSGAAGIFFIGKDNEWCVTVNKTDERLSSPVEPYGWVLELRGRFIRFDLADPGPLPAADFNAFPVYRTSAPAVVTDPRIAPIFEELERATVKFPTWPTDPLHAFAVVGEEFGECQKEVLQLVYEPHKSSLSEVRKEAIQMAAMALRFVMSLHAYRYEPLDQHQQEPLTVKD